MTFNPFGATIGNLAPPLPVASGGTGAITAAAALADLGGLVLQAATPVAGFALQNATPSILTWTVPSDGLLHRVLIFGNVHVSLASTGGVISFNGTAPDGSGIVHQLDGGTHAAGVFGYTARAETVQAGSTVTVAQTSAMTAGTAAAWAEIWGL